jgi:hypothetical protein
MTCKTPEEFKAWSQNLGHEKVLTTFTSYGAVAAHRQAALIKGLAANDAERPPRPTLEARLAKLEAAIAKGSVGAA